MNGRKKENLRPLDQKKSISAFLGKPPLGECGTYHRTLMEKKKFQKASVLVVAGQEKEEEKSAVKGGCQMRTTSRRKKKQKKGREKTPLPRSET